MNSPLSRLLVLSALFLNWTTAWTADSQTSNRAGDSQGEPRLEELRKDADATLLLTDNIEIHAGIGRVFRFVDRLIADRKPAEALRYLTNALPHAPWRLDYQLVCAELFQKSGSADKAKEKAELVLSVAETDSLINKASALLGKSQNSQLKPETIPMAGTTLVIFPIGPIESWLVNDLKSKLAAATGFQIVYHPLDVKLGEPSRNHTRDYAENLRLQIRKNLTKSQVDAKLVGMGFRAEDFSNDERVFDLLRDMFTKEATKETVRRWEAELEQLKRLSLQWNADELLTSSKEKTQPLSRPKLGWLAVTSADLFAGNNRYVFALSSPQHNISVMSYLRFTAAVVAQPPDSSRLAERTFKQALSSAGFAFGIPRCDSPRCARSYANSLGEHDAKGSRLCAACTKGFEQLRK